MDKRTKRHVEISEALAKSIAAKKKGKGSKGSKDGSKQATPAASHDSPIKLATQTNFLPKEKDIFVVTSFNDWMP
jgi:hypothetical protein